MDFLSITYSLEHAKLVLEGQTADDQTCSSVIFLISAGTFLKDTVFEHRHLEKGLSMRKFSIVLPLFALIAACSDNESLENKGRDAGAAADNAIDRMGNRVDAERDELENRAANVGDKARGVKQDVKESLSKADNAVDAAAAELKK
jgi:hypothetical protein